MLRLIDTFDIPDWSLSYLVNGDTSDLSDDELKLVNGWIDSLDYNRLSYDCSELDAGFTNYPEFGLPCNCHSVEVWGHKIVHKPKDES